MTGSVANGGPRRGPARRRGLTMALVLLAVLPAGARAQRAEPAGARERAGGTALARILGREYARHPRMEAQDVYKLLFQAAMGSRHAGLDSAMAAQWLGRESDSLPQGPPEPVLDTISPDGRMVRVNLRPYLAAGGSRDALLGAFVTTARVFAGSAARLRLDLAEAERLAGAGALPLPRAALHRYFKRMAERGYPAVEHSAAYEAAYHPAYRVVLLPLLPPTVVGVAP